eukprot:g32149.t1
MAGFDMTPAANSSCAFWKLAPVLRGSVPTSGPQGLGSSPTCSRGVYVLVNTFSKSISNALLEANSQHFVQFVNVGLTDVHTLHFTSALVGSYQESMLKELGISG